MTEFGGKSAEFNQLERESLEWILRLTSGQATQADAAALAAWKARSPAHAAAFENALRLRARLREAGREFLARPAHSIPLRPTTMLGSGVNRRAVLGGAAAAAAAGILIARPPLDMWPSFADLTADYRTSKGEQRHVALSRGVSLILNTQSALSVASRNAGLAINLLSGEVNVQVDLVNGNRLTVTAGDSTVVATKAGFNVLRERVGGGCVSCLAGGIEIRRLGKVVRLKENEQLAYAADAPGHLVPFDRGAAADWLQGLLVFHDMPLSEMVRQINRYRSGRIFIANDVLARKRFNGQFHINQLDGALVAIQKLDVRVSQFPGGIVLLS